MLQADELAVKARLDVAAAEERAVLQRAYDAVRRRRAFFVVLAFTGLRKGEAFRMRWSWIDFDGRMLRVRVAKRGSSEIPLCKTVANVLKALGPGPADDLVFPGSPREAGRAAPLDRTKMLTDMRVPLVRALQAAKVDTRGVTLHTFRRTFLTLIEEIPGVTFSMVVALARHGKGSTGVTARYLKPSNDILHAALAELERRVLGTGNVIPLFGRPA